MCKIEKAAFLCKIEGEFASTDAIALVSSLCESSKVSYRKLVFKIHYKREWSLHCQVK